MRDRATATLTTVVVDDEQLACDELAYLLKDFPEVEVIARGSNGLEALELVQKLEPDLVFLDVHMPGLDGLGVVRRLREKLGKAGDIVETVRAMRANDVSFERVEDIFDVSER